MTNKEDMEFILLKVLSIIQDSSIDLYERHLMIKLLEKLIQKDAQVISSYADKIFGLVSWMISSDNFLFRIESKEIVSTLAKSIGLSKVILVLRMNLDS